MVCKKKMNVICFLMLLLFALLLPIVHAKFGDSPEILFEKTLSDEIRNIDASSNYIVVSAGKEIILFDITGKELWRYAPPATDEIHAVAISPSESYIVADGRYKWSAAGQIHLIGIDKMLIESIEYEGPPINYFDLDKPNASNIDFVYKYGEKGYFLAVRSGTLQYPVLTYVKEPTLNKTKITQLGMAVSNKNFTFKPEYGDLLYTDEYGHVWRRGAWLYTYTSGPEKIYDKDTWILTLVNSSARVDSDDRIVWQFKQNRPIQNVGFIRNGDKVVASSGNTLFILDNPLIKELPSTSSLSGKPSTVVLANSIDYTLASDFFGFLKNKNKEAVRANASDFSQYKNEKFIVILGGPDAPEGIGSIVREVLSEIEENFLRQDETSKMFIKTDVWTQGQVVMVIAGNNRYQTQKAHVENKDTVLTEIGG